MARKYFIMFNWRSHTRHLSFLDLCSTTDETLESSLGKKCFSSFKLLNGGLYGVWYHNLALTERFLAWSLLEVHWRSTWSLFEVLLMNSEVHEVSSIKSEYWKLEFLELLSEPKMFWHLPWDGASGHVTSVTIVTLELREAPVRGGLLHAGALQRRSAYCSTRGTHSHLYWWAPSWEVVVLKQNFRLLEITFVNGYTELENKVCF